MEQRPVGRSGMRVSALALSTATWGATVGHGTDPDGAAALLTSYRAAGGTLLNLAAGSPAETIAGALLGTERDALLLASRAASTGDGASRSGLLGQLDASLRRIGVDHLDLWQVPVGDPGVPFEETLAALDHAVDTGRARYIGVVEHGAWRLARAATWQRAWPGRHPIVSDRVEYSLLCRGIEADVIPAAGELGVGLLAYAPLAGGALVGRGTDVRGSRGAGADLADRGDARALGIVEAVATAADGLATTAVAVAVSWLRDRPGVTSVVVGARTTAHLAAVLQAEALVLPAAIRQALDDVSVPLRGYDEPPRTASGDVR